ncbi:MAG: hypothetical protein ACTSRS_07940 [Candidatus Helarchaeota archaeon]
MTSAPEISNSIIELTNLNDFKKFAKQASSLLYEPIYFPSPFLNEHWIRCVNCYCLGVNFSGISIIIKYQKSYKDIKQDIQLKKNLEWKKVKELIDAEMRKFITEIKKEFHAVKGNIKIFDRKVAWNELIFNEI